MRRVINLIIIPLLLLSPSTFSFVIDCYFNEWDWNFESKVYECQGKPVDIEYSPGYVVDVTGLHMKGGNNTEVQALRFMHHTSITFLPNGIGKFFPNLKGLSFLNCNIKDISKDHLSEFPAMRQVSYNLNRIEYVPGDTFIYTPNLEIINLANNNIKRIGARLFKPIKHLEYIWLEKNSCIDMNARNFELKGLRKEIRKKCIPGGTECKRLPKLFRTSNATKTVDVCEAVKVYRFRPKPRHELAKYEREKAMEAIRDRENGLKKLKICENADDIYRFFETIYYEDFGNVTDPDIQWALNDTFEKKITDSLVNISKKKK